MKEEGWTSEQAVTLAKLLEEKPSLWCRNDNGYKKKIVRLDAIKNIATALGKTHLEIDSKIKSIIGQFQREVRKEGTLNLKSGSKAGQCYVSKWFLYPHLSFLTSTTGIRDTAVDSSTPLNALIEEITSDDQQLDDVVLLDEEQDSAPDEVQFLTPSNTLSKPYRKRKTDDNTLNETVRNLANTSSKPANNDSFGLMVSEKLNALKNPILRYRAEYEISEILFKTQAEDEGFNVITNGSRPIVFRKK